MSTTDSGKKSKSPKRTVPRYDWQNDFINYTNYHYQQMVRNSKRDRSMYGVALKKLREFGKPIYVTKTGDHKGELNLPKGIDNSILLKFDKIIRGEEEIPTSVPDLPVDQEKFYKDIQFRDSKYALFAAIYLLTKNIDDYILRNNIVRCMARYTDHRIESTRFENNGA